MLEATELKRLAYLEAMGMDSYVSRQPLPAAAASRKLAIVTKSTSAPRDQVESSPVARVKVGLLDDLQRDADAVAESSAPALVPEPEAGVSSNIVQSFSIVAIFAGGWLWLEELSGVPLATEQVQLISAMARALNLNAEKPLVAQFDWPIHTNQQLDLGPEAAISSLAGFVQRKVVEFKAGRVVALGDACQRRLPSVLEDSLPCVATISTRQMLSEPGTKKQAWRDLSAAAKSG
ncbi:MAG: hypothetical protein ACJA09_002162 [Alcanivorax sp.]|jgi:hypothetical protein